MLRSYALAPETIRRFLRHAFWRFQGITTLSFLLFGLYLAWFGRPVNWSFAGPLVGIIALAYFFIIFFNYRQQIRILYSARYEIDEAGLAYRQLEANSMRLMRADLKEAQERKDGLQVETVEGVTLLVPYGLARDGDFDFRSTLQAWVGVKPLPPSQSAPRFWLFILEGVGALAILVFANSLWVIVPLIVFVIAFGAYTERRLAKVHDVPPGIVRMYNTAFSFLIFVIFMKACLVIFNLLLVMRTPY